MMYWGSGKKRICGCCIRIRAGISVRIRVRDGVMISNRVRRRVKLVNYSLITAFPIATSADPHIRLSTFYPWPKITTFSDIYAVLVAAPLQPSDCLRLSSLAAIGLLYCDPVVPVR